MSHFYLDRRHQLDNVQFAKRHRCHFSRDTFISHEHDDEQLAWTFWWPVLYKLRWIIRTPAAADLLFYGWLFCTEPTYTTFDQWSNRRSFFWWREILRRLADNTILSEFNLSWSWRKLWSVPTIWLWRWKYDKSWAYAIPRAELELHADSFSTNVSREDFKLNLSLFWRL